jgi:hypothetical protein
MPTLSLISSTFKNPESRRPHHALRSCSFCGCSLRTASFVCALLAIGAPFAHAEQSSTDSLQQPYRLTLQTSVATRHFHPDPAQNNHQDLLNLEWNYDSNLLVGAAAFRNTFRQSTQLVYWGAKFHPIQTAPGIYLKVVGGLLHGYRGEYRDKIPFNKYGTAPVILPAAGYCYKQVCSELIVFGTAGAMLTAGVRF